MFGRRKPGFSEEVIITEFVAEVNEDRIKDEETAKEEKQDLIDYLGGLEGIGNIEDLEETIEIPKKTKPQLLADFIRERSKGAHLTSKSLLLKEEEEEALGAMLQSLEEDESCKDIVSIKGDRGIYFYSTEFMSDNYAMMAMLVDEKNLSKTIAEMVRWNGKTYPCPTPVYYFKNSPYLYTEPQIERALALIKDKEEYKDIGELLTGNDVKYLYSTLHMSEKYARALAEGVEYGEYGY